jgi:hypothetical protein
MSRFSDCTGAGLKGVASTLIALAALGCAAATLAADQWFDPVHVRTHAGEPADQGGSAAEPARGSAERQAPVAGKSAKGQPQSMFRCWQDGRMIFEGRGYGALPQQQIAAELKAADGAAGRIQVLDMYQGLCVLELPK